MQTLNFPTINLSDFLNCLPNLMASGIPAMLFGPPGVGKSTAVRLYAEKHNIYFDVKYLGQMLAGELSLPTVDTDDKGEKTLSWAIADFMKKIPHDRPSILLLDEINAASPDVVIQAYQILAEHGFGDFKFPKSCYIIAAGNRSEDGALVFDMNTALADRLVMFNIEPNAKQWLEDFAIPSGVHPYVLATIKSDPRVLTTESLVESNAKENNTKVKNNNLVKPTPRSWERVSHFLKTEPSKEIRRIVVPGIVGSASAAKLEDTIQSALNLYPVEDYMKATDEELLKMSPKELPNLYTLAYVVNAYCSTAEDFIKAMNMFVIFNSINDGISRTECMTMAFQMFISKARTQQSSLLLDIAKSKVFREKINPAITAIPKFNTILQELKK